MKQPIYTSMPGSREIRLIEDFEVDIPLGGNERTQKIHICGEKRTIRIPKGFKSDGASIPRLFWTSTYGPFNPLIIVPALVHDYGYMWHHFEIKTAVEPGIRRYSVNRKEVDEIFLGLLRDAGVSHYQRYKMYWAVRMFGGFVWKK